MVQGNYIHSSRQTIFTRQRRFERTAIEYDQIKDEIFRMESVEYNDFILRNIMNKDDLEYIVI